MSTIHLQGLGEVQAIEAERLQVGDILHYNQTYGQYIVTRIERKGLWVTIWERNLKTGIETNRKRHRSTLVGYTRG